MGEADHALGIDVGLSGVRASVVRADGALAGTGRRPHAWHLGEPGRAEHDPRDWLAGMRTAARSALAAAGAPRIAAVGVTAVGPAPVLVDAGLRPLTAAPLFALDRRAWRERDELARGLGPDAARGMLDHALPTLLHWRRAVPDAFERAAWALDATGFVVAALTGVPVMDTVTAADYAWPGVPAPLPLPEPLAPGAVAGGLTPEAARRLGLPDGIPVTAGTYDSFVDLFEAGVRRPGDAGMVLGSTLIVCRAVEAADPVDGLGTSRYPGAGVLLGGWTLGGGAVLDWFAQMVGADAAAAARLEPGAGGLLALPYFAGERTPIWDPAARGALFGLTYATTREHMLRAFVDSLALAARDHTERLEPVLGPCPVWRATGGGTGNAAWLQATADAIGARVDVVDHAGAAVAPALLALRAIGHDPPRAVRATAEPDERRHEAYGALYARYRRLQEVRP